MHKVKEDFLDRIEQSFVLFKDNFLGLFLPFFLYNFISIVLVSSFLKYYFVKSLIGLDILNGFNFMEFFVNPKIILLISIFIILFLLYLLFYIVVLLGFIKSVKQAYNEEKITIIENIFYGFKKFFDSMRVYWNIFVYVALIPCIFFIIGGILLNYGLYFENENIVNSSVFVLITSIFYFIVSLIYRGLKTSFSIYNAVDKDDYLIENFTKSIQITNNNWWRILGNFILVSLLLSFVGSFIGLIIGSFKLIANKGLNIISLLNINDVQNIENLEFLQTILNEYINNFSIHYLLISNFIDNILVTLFSVFTLIFTYLFFKRLEIESKK